MRTTSYRKPITYDDFKELASPKRIKPAPVVIKNPFDDVESQDDEYCDLSVSILSEEPFDDKQKRASPVMAVRSDLLKAVKVNLAELKNEATLYVRSGDKAVQETNKKLRESVYSVESFAPDNETINILNDLRVSVKTLHERLEKNEELFSSKRYENQELQKIVDSLESKVNEQSVIDTSKNQTQCICVIY